MNNDQKTHAGIELDVVNISQLNKIPPVKSEPYSKAGKIDYKIFVKEIFKKILQNDSFLTFSVQISDINKILKMKYSSANDIANVILKDVALTTKLLKLVNSSFYGQFTQKKVATVSEAMIILGTEEIKLAAASLKIFELMQDIANVKVLKDKALKAMQRSLIAKQLALDIGLKDAEAIQISAMLYDFGEYLVALFSPEVFINIEIQLDDTQKTREEASKKVIGISYSELGRFVASKWNLPPTIIYAMKPITELDQEFNQISINDMQRYICSFSNELCDIDFNLAGEYIGTMIAEISDKYKYCLEVTSSQSVELLKMSWNNIEKHASILKV